MKLLYLCHRIPYPPDKGDKIRSYHQVDYLARRHELDLFTLIDDPADRGHAESLARRVRYFHASEIAPRRARLWSARALVAGGGLSVAYFQDRRLARALADRLARERYDAAVVFSSAMAPYLEDVAVPQVHDFVDVDSAKWLAYADTARFPASWLYRREGRELRRLERSIAERAAATVLCAAREEAELRSFCAPRRAVTVPNGTDVEYFQPDTAGEPRPDVVFSGAMDYRANVDAVLWFAEHVWPTVRRELPAARLVVVGSNPAPRVQALDREPGIAVTGRVPDVRPYLRAATVAVAPLRVARGIQNKVLEALACGVPVVATSAALGGIGAARGAVVADAPEAFAAAVVALFRDEPRRRALGLEGRAFVVEQFDWNVRLREFEAVIRDASSAAAAAADEP